MPTRARPARPPQSAEDSAHGQMDGEQVHGKGSQLARSSTPGG